MHWSKTNTEEHCFIGIFKECGYTSECKKLKTMNCEIKYGSNESQCSEFSHYTGGLGISLGIFRL